MGLGGGVTCDVSAVGRPGKGLEVPGNTKQEARQSTMDNCR